MATRTLGNLSVAEVALVLRGYSWLLQPEYLAAHWGRIEEGELQGAALRRAKPILG